MIYRVSIIHTHMNRKDHTEDAMFFSFCFTWSLWIKTKDGNNSWWGHKRVVMLASATKKEAKRLLEINGKKGNEKTRKKVKEKGL